MDDRLQKLAGQSSEHDTLIVELVYHDRYVQFDINAMELKYLPMTEIIERYFSKAFAAVQVPTADSEAPALASSSSETNV